MAGSAINPAMPPISRSNRQLLALFGFLGFGLGIFFPSLFAERIFYTTEPFAFLSDLSVFALALLFGLSFAMIPLATMNMHHSSSIVRYPGALPALAVFWAIMTALTSVVVSFVTATVHHRTLDIPAWSVPVGLSLVALLPGITILFTVLWRSRRELGR